MGLNLTLSEVYQLDSNDLYEANDDVCNDDEETLIDTSYKSSSQLYPKAIILQVFRCIPPIS